jgi:RNA polymerase sigma factor (sigma-70 family)
MAYLASGSVIRQLGSLFDGGSVAGLSDRQLLERFAARRDDAAFAALVARHGPMVLGVCRQLLGDRHHAEDAFQAVFLVLARKARSIRDPDLLGNWLYGVALRTARCARLRLARRRECEEARSMSHPGPDSTVPADQPAIDREQAEALHAEIDRLPNTFRLPVVLCYFEGLTVEEAARQLRWPHGTVRSRLARARDKLRRGLTRRGVVLPAAALAAALDARPASASVSSPLCDITIRAALTGQTTSTLTTALAREVLRSMLIHKLKFTAMTLLFVSSVATGAGFLSHALAMKDKPRKEPAGPQPKVVAKLDDAPAPGRMFVVGRVLDPQGKPMAGVPIDIVGRSREQWLAARGLFSSQRLLGRGETDGDGRFRLDASRTSSDRFFEVYALASAPGFGLGWAQLNADAEQPASEIKLRPEQVVRGKLVDINGQPAAGVELRIVSVGRPSDIGTFDGVSMGNFPAPEGLFAWPQPVKTDDQGRFSLPGIGHNLTLAFSVRDIRFAAQGFRIQTDDRQAPKAFTLALKPATIVEGRALADDTGQPMPHAVVNVASGENEMSLERARFLADDQGRYTANVAPGKFYRIQTFPPEGPPYLVTSHDFAWNKGAIKTVVDLKLRRGIVIRGKVTEEGTGRPIAGAAVQYLPARSPNDVISGYTAVVASKDDGSYQIVVSPGKGHLFVYGPTSDYILEVIGGRMIYSGQPGGERYYAHDIIAYDVKAGDSPHELDVTLRPGKTIKGRLIGPEGQSVESAEIIAVLHFSYLHLNWRGDLTRHARDGRFTLHGLDPEKPTRVSFLDADHQWGTTIELSGKQAGEETTVRLQPCGTARARFVGPDGKPKAKIASFLELLGTPGRHVQDSRPESKSKLAADAVSMVNLDRKHYWNGPRSDADGRITLPDLIPGALYRIGDQSIINDDERGAQLPKEFTVKPGETLDLGEIPIGK